MKDDEALIADISEEIVEFICANPGACDACRGIENCWLQRNRHAAPRLVEAALSRLVAEERLRRIDMLGTAPLYAARLPFPTERFARPVQGPRITCLIPGGTRS